MKKLYEPSEGILTVKYLPNENDIIENPPRFCWLPANKENGPYTLEIASDAAFEGPVTQYAQIKRNFFAPAQPLAPGTYYWRYTITGKEYNNSQVRSFTIAEGLPNTAIEGEETRLQQASMAHPRLLMDCNALEVFQKQVQADASHCFFDQFVEHAVRKFVDQPLVAEPQPYPENKRIIAWWRKSFCDCQAAFNHIKFMGIASVVLAKEDWKSQAIEALVTMANWDATGATARDYNDESAFRVAGALAWGYDWLYNDMDDAQREVVFRALYQRTKDVAEHALVASKIHYSLYDSHAVRSLSSVLIPCCIALMGHCDEAEDWLNYTIDYLNVLYTPWGGADGGWSEGGLYWTTGLAYLIEALHLVKNYTGVNIFARPFFQQTGNFPLYCFAHDTYRASFCDQSNLGDKPILKTGFNARELAGATGNGELQWYFEQVAKRERYDDDRFFNTGWWDFYYDEFAYQYNNTAVVATAPATGRNVRWFKDIGWVAMHSNMDVPEEHICMITKSSPYGSVSHSHGDQNAMLLFAYGEPLLIESGYYIGFNSSMHRQWRKNTRSKNTLLINGKGQYDQLEKTTQLSAVGQIVEVTQTDAYVKVVENATLAYLPNAPELKDYTREIYFVDDSYFVVVDYVTLKEKGDISYQLHSLHRPTFVDSVYAIHGKQADLTCEFAYVSSGAVAHTIDDTFTNVDPKEIEGLDNHWHFALTTGKATSHVMVSCLYPSKNNEFSSVETIKDDQGHDVYLYFTRDGKTFPLCIPGDKRY